MERKMESGFADVNGIRLHYVSSGQGPLLLFVHGFPEFWGAWKAQLNAFGGQYQAVAVDMRGYNLSSRPPDPEEYHVTALIADLRALADHLGHDRFTLVGHDWGGAAAWSLAARYPQSIDKLIIINAPHPIIYARELLFNPEQRKASEYMLLFRSSRAEKILSENRFAFLINLLSRWGSKWNPSAGELQAYIEAWSRPGALTGGLNYYRASPLYPPTSEPEEKRIHEILGLRREMFTIKPPTLVIWGELDSALLPDNLNGLEDFVEDLTVKRIADGTHWVVHEQTERVNDLIEDFLTT